MEVCVLVGATVGIGSKVEPWAALTPWRRWPAVSSSRSWTKRKMGMVGRMGREKRNRERRKKGREKGGAAGRRRGRRSGRRRRRRQWVDGDGCAGGRRRKKCSFNMSKAKFKKLSPTTCHPASPLSRRVERSKKCEKTENLKVSKDRSPEECPSSKSIPNFNIILTSFITFSLKYFYEISLFYKVIFGF